MKNTAFRSPTLAMLLTVIAGTAQCEERIYLLARVAIVNTTYAQAAFFFDKDATTLKACEEDIARGNNGQWQYYGHAVKKIRGAATTVSYACVKTDLSINEWQASNHYSYVYLIDRRQPDIKVTLQANYAECLTSLRKTQKEESNTYFCAKMNQIIDSTKLAT